MEIFGQQVSPGVVVGQIYLLDNSVDDELQSPSNLNGAADLDAYYRAKERAVDALDKLYHKTLQEVGEEEALIVDAQRMMLLDEDVDDAVRRAFEKEQDLVKAIECTFRDIVTQFEALEDEYLRARTADVLDIKVRLLRALNSTSFEIELPSNSIIVSDDISPSQALSLDRKQIAAFVMRKGSSTSHIAILANSLGIPALINTPIGGGQELVGRIAIVDSLSSRVVLDPSVKAVEETKSRIFELEKAHAQVENLRGKVTETRSGKRIKLYANICSVDDAYTAAEADAEGVGLFRTEFMFIGRSGPPSLYEQFDAYRTVAKAMCGRQVIIRTLDIGADKVAAYLKLGDEGNPALGYRAIRILLDDEKLFKTQLRAMYMAAAEPGCNIAIMFPMIASTWEVKKALGFCAEVQEELLSSKTIQKKPEVPVGVMVETPAAALIAEDLAKLVSFFSVGTNDLTQYTLAIDRQGSQKLDKYFDPQHPALFELLKMTASAATRNGIWAGICGELAADLSLVQNFIDWGFTELSVSPRTVLPLRQRILEIE
ncbi:MAG: phosphoenolpyruvate--protein phosphotransferase [Candidatus Ancillula trichonymphae]|jgi:phosphotransferase system enzyme I (PtsI)|nr:phosphoenolpyruvate--protein phosphotransferase [Candidatus Ancillula trichonymphae]